MFILRYFSACLIIMLFISNIGSAQTNTEQKESASSFYSNNSEQKGWWWYDYYEQKRKEEEKKQKEAESSKKYPSLKDYTYDELWNMDPQEFSKLLDSMRNKAIKTLKEEDTIDYLIMQDIAVRKSEAYANVAMYAAQKYQELSEPKVPVTVPGVLSKSMGYKEETDRVLSQYREKYGVLYFTQVGCSYCEEQSKIIKNYWSSYVGLELLEIDIHDKPELATHFNISITPTLILIERDTDNAFPVSSGVNDIATIKRNIYSAIKYLEGERTPDKFLQRDLDLKYDALNNDDYYRKFYEKHVSKNNTKKACGINCGGKE